MNVKAIAVSQLKKMREPLVAELAGIEAAIAALSGIPTTKASAPAPKRNRKKRTLTPEQIAKMQAGRAAKRAGKAQDGQTTAEAPQTKESHPRLPTGPPEAKVPKGASLAEAAS